MNLLDRLYDKLEVFRLEQRYMRRRNRDTPKAQYVNGEYIYTPTTSYSAKCSGGNSDTEAVEVKDAENKSKLGRRLSKMGLDKADWKKTKEEKRRSRAAAREVKWDWEERT